MFDRKEYIRNYQRAWMKKRRDEWIIKNGPCRKCGSWVDLEIDHKDRATKSFHPGMIWSWSKERRESELSKCQVLCRLCHDKKTREEFRTHPEHGTVARYNNRVYKCRCELCTKAASSYAMERRRIRGYR